jgi:fermentation-respiration switch protein FrsA (DUF1100 family)
MAMTAPPPSVPPQRSWRSRIWRLLRNAAFCYVGVIIVLMLLENWLLFHPTPASTDWGPPPNARVQDVYLQIAEGIRIHAWWCPVENGKPTRSVLLYCHGNAGNLSYRAPAIAEMQKELGTSILSFDYPGFGKSEGKPNETVCYASADAAYDWLTQVQNVPPERILLYGKSLGGGVAVDLACRRPHRALILAKTFTSIPDMAQSLYPWLPARWLVRSRFDNLEKIRRCTQPVFMAYGTADGLIPFVQGERLFAAANEPKRFLAMPGIDHNGGVTPEFYSTLRDFLAQVEQPGRRPIEAGVGEN